jgi:bifunctional DNA-binding transcriptional regulator/antitoxin component of YhaV-PrlF toxin-antitoxin module
MPRRKRSPDPRLVDNRNRVALPPDVMRGLDLKPGDYVAFIVDLENGVRLYKLSISVSPPPF